MFWSELSRYEMYVNHSETPAEETSTTESSIDQYTYKIVNPEEESESITQSPIDKYTYKLKEAPAETTTESPTNTNQYTYKLQDPPPQQYNYKETCSMEKKTKRWSLSSRPWIVACGTNSI